MCILCEKKLLPRTYRQFPISLNLALDSINFNDKEVFEKVDVLVSKADIIKYHRLGSSERSFFPCTSGGWKSKIKVLAGFVFPRPLLTYRGLSSPCLHTVFPLCKSMFKFHLKGCQPCWIRAYISDLTHLLHWRLYLQMYFEALGVRTSISEFVEGDTILPLTQDKLLFCLCCF